MFKKWFEGKLSKTQLEEAQQFLRMLRGANESVIESIAAGTMFWAAIYEAKGLELYDIAFWINDNPLFVMELHKQIRGFQKRGQPQNAPGLMVWLHTARAASYPELKETARQIWAELERAPETAIELANSAAENAGIMAPLCYNRVPHDFETIGGGL